MNNEMEVVKAGTSALSSNAGVDADELSEEILEHVSGGVTRRPQEIVDDPTTDVTRRPQ